MTLVTWDPVAVDEVVVVVVVTVIVAEGSEILVLTAIFNILYIISALLDVEIRRRQRLIKFLVLEDGRTGQSGDRGRSRGWWRRCSCGRGRGWWGGSG